MIRLNNPIDRALSYASRYERPVIIPRPRPRVTLVDTRKKQEAK